MARLELLQLLDAANDVAECAHVALRLGAGLRIGIGHAALQDAQVVLDDAVEAVDQPRVLRAGGPRRGGGWRRCLQHRRGQTGRRPPGCPSPVAPSLATGRFRSCARRPAVVSRPPPDRADGCADAGRDACDGARAVGKQQPCLGAPRIVRARRHIVSGCWGSGVRIACPATVRALARGLRGSQAHLARAGAARAAAHPVQRCTIVGSYSSSSRTSARCQTKIKPRSKIILSI